MCVLIPLAILIVYFNISLKRNTFVGEVTIYDPFSITKPESPPTDLVMDIMYSPCNKPYLNGILTAAAAKLSIKYVDCVRSSNMVNANSALDTLCAITFDDDLHGNAKLFKIMNIVFR